MQFNSAYSVGSYSNVRQNVCGLLFPMKNCNNALNCRLGLAYCGLECVFGQQSSGFYFHDAVSKGLFPHGLW